jgi:WD40 repeat protein
LGFVEVSARSRFVRPPPQLELTPPAFLKPDLLFFNQPGIISCLAFNPPTSDLLAAGSYSGAVGVFDARTDEQLLLMEGHKGGVTQVLGFWAAVVAGWFCRSMSCHELHRRVVPLSHPSNNPPNRPSPTTHQKPPHHSTAPQVMFSHDGNYLYSGARRDPTINCWDVRNTAAALYAITRDAADTNQRVQFDIDGSNRHLATGGCDGRVRVSSGLVIGLSRRPLGSLTQPVRVPHPNRRQTELCPQNNTPGL